MKSSQDCNVSLSIKDVMLAMPEGYTAENGFRIKIVFQNGDKIFWLYQTQELRDYDLLQLEQHLAEHAF